MLLIHSGVGRSHLVFSQPPMTHRFAGFAGLQAQLATSDQYLIRAAGTATFFARRATGRNTEATLRRLIKTCQSDIEEQLITNLCHYDMQLAERWAVWHSVIESLLSEELYGDLKPFLTERMIRLLENENQSLHALEEALSLPLGS